MKRIDGWSAALRAFGVSHRAVAIAVTFCLLTSCGGGGLADLAGGVGSGGSGLAEGTITGFGSVHVDGVSYDDSRAVLTRQGAAGEEAVPALKIGQRVRVRGTTAGVADSIEVITELIGPIEAIDAFAGGQWLTVLGQRVRVDRSAEGTAGADTWVDFGESDCVDDGGCALQRDQWVQVHGSWVRDLASNRDQLFASRVEVLEPQTSVLLSGVVRHLDGRTVRLNASGGREIDLTASGGALAPAVEQLLRVWAPADDRAAPSLPASRAVTAQMVPDGTTSRVVLGGEIAKVIDDGREIEIQGTRIAVPPGLQGMELDPGRFALVEIEKGPAGWLLKAPPELPDNANRAVVRISADVVAAELVAAQAGIWRLRDTKLVRVSAQQAMDGGCTGLNPTKRVRVDVHALRGPLPLRIESIRCDHP